MKTFYIFKTNRLIFLLNHFVHLFSTLNTNYMFITRMMFEDK